MGDLFDHFDPGRVPRLLPMSAQEMRRLGWSQLDILLVSGDAYVDHPSFGAALLGKWLAAFGYRVGVVAQPRWTSPDDLKAMGRPRLFAGVTAGALDSMLAHYTAFRKKRSDDAYTPGGQAGARPNRAAIVYASLVKQAFPKLPIVLGGIEASLRRLTHFDFWTDKLRRSILLDAKADLILFGMAERGVLEVARTFAAWVESENHAEAGGPGGDPRAFAQARPSAPPISPTALWAQVSGATFIGDPSLLPAQAKIIELPSHEDLLADGKKLMEATLAMEHHVHHANAFAIQRAEGRAIISTPPRPLETPELDRLYSLPFTREPHPSYDKPIPAAEMIRFSINSHRGCAGGCSFCTLSAHQGRTIKSRSEQSILGEAQAMTQHPRFTGSITDVGGPSANMWGAYCADDPSTCERASCLHPAVCPHFVVDQMQMVELMRKVKAVKKVKHVRVASGIRYDLALQDRQYIKALVQEFVGGQLKIAPEHLSDSVLKLMRKPGSRAFEQFLDLFAQECEQAGKEQYVVPYLISAFPGCTSEHMKHLASWLAKRGWRPQQVQCFIPLPGTTSAAMYYAGIDEKGRPIPVARTDAERLRMHHTLMQSQPTVQIQHRRRN